MGPTNAEVIASNLRRMRRLQIILLIANVLIFVVQLVNLMTAWKIIQILQPGWLPW